MAFSVADSISERIGDKRKQKGFLLKEMADYLRERWDVGMSNAICYIRDVENNLFTRLDNKKYVRSQDRLKMHETRICDYLASLGIDGEEAEDIFRDIRKIRPDFNPVRSDIKPYKKVLR